MKKNNKNLIVVAMSGGVDSSVSAALLKKAGFNVLGVYMRQWSPTILGEKCIWKQDRQDAMQVAARLKIPFETWDFSKEYQKEVGEYMIKSYKKGITPNPDVMCNNVIKFGLFYKEAMRRGASFVATGHYARISLGDVLSLGSGLFSLSSAPLALRASRPRASKSSLPREQHLLKAEDKNKDQTYFLYGVKKNQLSKIIFPVGNLTKPEVRKLAKKFKLHNFAKKDSQGVCFVGQFNMKNFLKEYISPKPGKIISLKGKVVGDHDGVYYYTIGQRHGLDIKNGQGPYYVVSKDIKKNIIYVGKEKDLACKEAKIIKINWLDKPKKFPALVDVRTRYRAPLKKAVLQKNGKLVFKSLDRAITSGQSAVFYSGNRVLGGGIIK